jgi:hypothetical protein
MNMQKKAIMGTLLLIVMGAGIYAAGGTQQQGGGGGGSFPCSGGYQQGVFYVVGRRKSA